MPNYLILKLVTGEEVIGRSESDPDDELINLEDALVIDYLMDENYQLITQLNPFFINSKEKLFTFTSKHIILSNIPTDEIIRDFEEIHSIRSEESEYRNLSVSPSTSTIQ